MRLRADVNFVLGTLAEGVLAGVAGFVREPGEKSRHKGFVWGVYVSRKWRAQGIGRKLFTELLQRAGAQPGLERITLCVATTQTAARGLYVSLGFQPYGCEPNALKIGETYIDEDLMVLRLPTP
jgi:ribosomal protein S18 acetylase RimI-like enzyme